MTENYEDDSTHYMPSRDLFLRECAFKDGLLVSAYVVNGAWYLKRDGENWNACDHFDAIVTTRPVSQEDYKLEVISKERIDKEQRIKDDSDDSDDIPF